MSSFHGCFVILSDSGDSSALIKRASFRESGITRTKETSHISTSTIGYSTKRSARLWSVVCCHSAELLPVRLHDITTSIQQRFGPVSNVGQHCNLPSPYVTRLLSLGIVRARLWPKPDTSCLAASLPTYIPSLEVRTVVSVHESPRVTMARRKVRIAESGSAYGPSP